jgi:hypothetical protein
MHNRSKPMKSETLSPVIYEICGEYCGSLMGYLSSSGTIDPRQEPHLCPEMDLFYAPVPYN